MLLLLLLHPFNGLFSKTTWVSQHQKGKPFWILLEQERIGGSDISWTICKSFAPRCRQISMPVLHHSSFYRPDTLLLPDQQHQSTEGKNIYATLCEKFYPFLHAGKQVNISLYVTPLMQNVNTRQTNALTDPTEIALVQHTKCRAVSSRLLDQRKWKNECHGCCGVCREQVVWKPYFCAYGQCDKGIFTSSVFLFWKRRKRIHIDLGVHCVEAHPVCGVLSQWGLLNPFSPAYNRRLLLCRAHWWYSCWDFW